MIAIEDDRLSVRHACKHYESKQDGIPSNPSPVRPTKGIASPFDLSNRALGNCFGTSVMPVNDLRVVPAS